MRAVLLVGVSFLTGILSGWGVGGGLVLLPVLQWGFGLSREAAQGTNLLYFLPTAAAGLWFHRRRGLLEETTVFRAVPWGLMTAVLGAWAATTMDTAWVEKPLGMLLLWTGLALWRKK